MSVFDLNTVFCPQSKQMMRNSTATVAHLSRFQSNASSISFFHSSHLGPILFEYSLLPSVSWGHVGVIKEIPQSNRHRLTFLPCILWGCQEKLGRSFGIKSHWALLTLPAPPDKQGDQWPILKSHMRSKLEIRSVTFCSACLLITVLYKMLPINWVLIKM